MYVITNRAIGGNRKNLGIFGKSLNPMGPNELRLVQVARTGYRWKVKPVADRLTSSTIRSLDERFNLGIDVTAPWQGSLLVACELFQQALEEKKSILFFVHGYNNDVEDVLETAFAIENLYDVIVVPFTWPANAGGAVSGAFSGISDKSDARASSGALNRIIGKIHYYHFLLTAVRRKLLQEYASKKFPDNPGAAYSHFVKLVEKDCPVTLNLLCHSIGNYVLKHTLSTSDNVTSKLVFDNINLVAADTNNDQHAHWVGKLDARNNINIVINESDATLKASRVAPGGEQLARLGQYPRQLDCPNANYIDISNAEHVGSEHTYFVGDAVENRSLQFMFSEIFCGRSVKQYLIYYADNNTFTLRGGLQEIKPTTSAADYQDKLIVDNEPNLTSGELPASESSATLKTIEIFLASSKDLKDDRDAFDLYFRQQNDWLRKDGFYLKIVRWENFIDAMADKGLQDEYNKAVRQCDIFVSLFSTKAGKYTEKEFDVAYKEFKKTGERPRVYTFFKNELINMVDADQDAVKSLWAFQSKLKQLNHYYTQYNDIEHLKLQFSDQLRKLLEVMDVDA